MAVHRLVKREFGAVLLVIGGALVLEWAEVFGDGGSALQLVGGIVLALIGLVFLFRNAVAGSD